MKDDRWKEEDMAEDHCFVCKDGGHLRVCDFKGCLKAYHSNCVGKDDLFLEDVDRWTCGLHFCYCGKSSSFHCFCCPTSYCHLCIKTSEFVQVKENKGFCISCLRLAKMIEEKRTVDSDGEEVDFNNTETSEFLFKDYWVIVKDKENLTIVDVQAADALFKRSENFKESDSDELIDQELVSEPDDLDDDSDDGKSLFEGLRGRTSNKFLMKRSRKERTFIGWASEELLAFLASIGKSTREPLSGMDVTEIVKEYVQSKNLFQPNKKRKNHVVPDEKLHSLFRKKKLKYHKISDLVKSHLTEEQSDPSDGFSLNSEEEGGTNFVKKQRQISSEYNTPSSEKHYLTEKILKPFRSQYAAIVVQNIKLAYLKRSLVVKLLNNPDTFEDKVIGCFVRIKNDRNDFYLRQKEHQLGQVTGIKKTVDAYKIGDTSTNVVLCVSNYLKDVKISMLSEDDPKEEECEDLRQLTKKGLFKPPTIADLQSKIEGVHEDIVNHWLNREISTLQRLIDRANEKGWRKELHEYIDRREELLKPEEQKRLVEEIPDVLPDTCDNETFLEDGTSKTNLDEPLSLCEVANENEPESKSNDILVLNKDVDGHLQNPMTSEIQVINLDDDDEDDLENAPK